MNLFIPACSTDEYDENDKLTVLYEKYLNSMMCVARKYVGQYQVEEDVVHEAIIKIMRNLDKIDLTMERQSKNFVCIITKCCAVDWLRKNQKIPCVGLDEVRQKDNPTDVPPIDYITTEEGYRHLVGLIHSLGDTYREVCELKFVGGMKERDFAGQLGISEKNVSVRVFRGRQKLIEMLKEEEKNG